MKDQVDHDYQLKLIEIEGVKEDFRMKEMNLMARERSLD